MQNHHMQLPDIFSKHIFFGGSGFLIDVFFGGPMWPLVHHHHTFRVGGSVRVVRGAGRRINEHLYIVG